MGVGLLRHSASGWHSRPVELGKHHSPLFQSDRNRCPLCGCGPQTMRSVRDLALGVAWG